MWVLKDHHEPGILCRYFTTKALASIIKTGIDPTVIDFHGMRLIAAENLKVGQIIYVDSEGRVHARKSEAYSVINNKLENSEQWYVKNKFEVKTAHSRIVTDNIDFARCYTNFPGQILTMNDNQYPTQSGAVGLGVAVSRPSQEFVVASEPTVVVNSVGTDFASFAVRVSIPVEGSPVGAKRDHYANFTASIEQLESMLVHVRKERARIKRLIAKAYDNDVKAAEANLQRVKNARKAEANKA